MYNYNATIFKNVEKENKRQIFTNYKQECESESTETFLPFAETLMFHLQRPAEYF